MVPERYASPPPVPLLRWHQRYAALRELLESYAGLCADDQPGAPSAALAGYLETMAFDSPSAPACAAAQLRALMEPGQISLAMAGRDTEEGAAYAMLPWPEVEDRWRWMSVVAELLEAAATTGTSARTGPPTTPWAVRRGFPMLHQLLGGYFGQDFFQERPGLSTEEAEAAAVDEWRSGVSPATRARTIGELHELLALDMERADLEVALGALGREAALHFDPGSWLRRLADRLAHS
jgi:hypothetical protein